MIRIHAGIRERSLNRALRNNSNIRGIERDFRGALCVTTAVGRTYVLSPRADDSTDEPDYLFISWQDHNVGEPALDSNKPFKCILFKPEGDDGVVADIAEQPLDKSAEEPPNLEDAARALTTAQQVIEIYGLFRDLPPRRKGKYPQITDNIAEVAYRYGDFTWILDKHLTTF